MVKETIRGGFGIDPSCVVGLAYWQELQEVTRHFKQAQSIQRISPTFYACTFPVQRKSLSQILENEAEYSMIN